MKLLKDTAAGKDAAGESEIIVENAGITTMSYNPVTQDYMLLKVNDTSHLKGR